MDNWLQYIGKIFNNIDFDDIETKETEHYLYKFYRKGGSYLSFEFVDNERQIRKIECGKYWLTDKDICGYEISNIKAVFDKTKNHFIDFIQVSFEGEEENNKYQLKYSDDNKKILHQFLNIPLGSGWKESSFKYKGDDYKISVNLELEENNLTFEIVLMHFIEQDLPMLGDSLEKRIRCWWADLKLNDSKRSFSTETIKPIRTLPNNT